MKRIIALILAMLMVLALVSCGKKDNTADDNANELTNEITGNDTAADTNDDAADNGEAEGTADTLGKTLLAAFKEIVKANPDMNAEGIANELITNPAILFSPAVMPVEEGLLSGFGEYEVKGFEEGAMFAPMIGSIAFVGYVFTLAEDADVDAFITGLEENCDPRWNICVEAEETVTGSEGNKVFFVMCPTTLEG